MDPANRFSQPGDLAHLGPSVVLFRAGECSEVRFVLLEGTMEIGFDDEVVEYS